MISLRFVTVQEDTSLANQQETQAHELDAVLLSNLLEKQSNTIILFFSSVSSNSL